MTNVVHNIDAYAIAGITLMDFKDSFSSQKRNYAGNIEDVLFFVSN